MKQEIESKYKRTGNIISGLGAILTILSIALFVIYSKGKKNEVDTLNLEKKKLIEQTVIDSLNIVQIKNIISDYTSAIQNHDEEKFIGFFSDSIQRFFLKENITAKDAFNEMKWFWNKYPSSSITYNLSLMTIDKIDNSGYLVFIPSINTRTKNDSIDILSELRINKENKIYYIRDFIASMQVPH